MQPWIFFLVAPSDFLQYSRRFSSIGISYSMKVSMQKPEALTTFGRVTYIADVSGKVVYIFDSHAEVQRHLDEALKICMLLNRTDYENN
jgi:peroxiredoxin